MISRNFAILFVLLLALGSGLPLSAQDLDDARDRRDEIAQEAAANAAEMDVLLAEDIEIVEALAELDSYLAIQEANLAEAEQQLQATLEQADLARSQADLLDTQIAALEQDIINRSVETYVGGRSTNTFLSTDDINDSAVMRFLAEDVNGLTTDMTDLLRLAKDQQREAVANADDAAREAIVLRDTINGQIAELETTQSAQRQVKAEVDARIAALESDSQALAAEDELIRQFILAEEVAREEARKAAEAAELEAQKRAEDQARAAAEEEARKRAEAEADADANNEPTPTPIPPTPTPTAPTVVLPVDPTTNPVGPGEVPAFIWPNNAPVVSPFGNRVHPVYGTVRFHAGLDIDARANDPTWAAAGGQVIFAGWRDGYGWAVIVDHGGGFTSLYAHLNSILVSEGQSVTAGAHVGLVGATGLATGAHLHFEIRINGSAVDPAPYLP